MGEFVRFLDPTTETPVVRLTNPAATSLLPAPTNRFVSVKDRFLLFSSDRAGRMSPFQADLHTGLVHQVTETSSLAPESLHLDPAGRLLYFIDGQILKEVSLSNRKVRPIREDISAFGVLSAGQFVVVRRGRLELMNGDRPPLAEDAGAFCLVRPGGNGCLFLRQTSREEHEFWYAPLAGDSAGSKPSRLVSGCISEPFWAPDGRSLLFLREVQNGGIVTSEIREVVPESGVEQRVAPTSQFAAFAPNGDASVFVGASRSKAQPTIILMLRAVQRELTLCEHRASHPGSVSPVFSPDSRRVYFQSDHEGKPSLYSVNVELLVEPTAAA
jgi:oligogalacturonide lyase